MSLSRLSHFRAVATRYTARYLPVLSKRDATRRYSRISRRQTLSYMYRSNSASDQHFSCASVTILSRYTTVAKRCWTRDIARARALIESLPALLKLENGGM